MATKVQVPLEEYLLTSYEPDREYLDGEIAERSVPKYPHSRAQARLASAFERVAKTHKLFACTEMRLQIAPTRVRVADLAVFAGSEPAEETPSAPPLATVEILSPDDRMTSVFEKLEEYAAWGVTHIWLVDAKRRRLFVYRQGGLEPVSSYALPEYGLEILPEDVF